MKRRGVGGRGKEGKKTIFNVKLFKKIYAQTVILLMASYLRHSMSRQKYF